MQTLTLYCCFSSFLLLAFLDLWGQDLAFWRLTAHVEVFKSHFAPIDFLIHVKLCIFSFYSDKSCQEKKPGCIHWIFACSHSQTEEFQVFRHRSAREAHSRQELDAHRVQTLEQMRADMEDRDRQLRAFGEQLDRGSRINRLQRERSAKEIRQVCTLMCYAPLIAGCLLCKPSKNPLFMSKKNKPGQWILNRSSEEIKFEKRSWYFK